MSKAYFQTDEYVTYHRQHCFPGTREDNGRVLGTEFIERVLSEMRFKQGDKVLEVGCGLDEFCNWWSVWGVAPFAFFLKGETYRHIAPLRVGYTCWLIYHEGLPSDMELVVATNNPSGVTSIARFSAEVIRSCQTPSQ